MTRVTDSEKFDWIYEHEVAWKLFRNWMKILYGKHRQVKEDLGVEVTPEVLKEAIDNLPERVYRPEARDKLSSPEAEDVSNLLIAVCQAVYEEYGANGQRTSSRHFYNEICNAAKIHFFLFEEGELKNMAAPRSPFCDDEE